MKPRSVSLLGLVAPTVTRVTDPLPIAAHHLAVVTRPWLLARGQWTRPCGANDSWRIGGAL